MERKAIWTIAVLLGFAVFALMHRAQSVRDYDPAVCAGPPLRTVEEREEAQVKGYDINRTYDCITRASHDQVAAAEAKWRAAQEEREKTKIAQGNETAGQDPAPHPSLAQARAALRTSVAVAPNRSPLPQPPAELYLRSDYVNPLGDTLPAFITPDPRDGKKHPAIVWLTGGDSSTLDDFWTEGPEDNDQSAQAFRKAGVVMLFPTLRGGNGNTRPQEFFLGEVDDVLAAAEHLARQPWVDAQQVYLGGHSTGGTLALLAAESSDRFAGVFAFGAVARPEDYGPSLVPAGFDRLDPQERRVRSPIFWLRDLSRPTYLVEGERGNSRDLQELCARPSPAQHCLLVPGHSHFSVLAPATRVIAARVAMAAEGIPFQLKVGDF